MLINYAKAKSRKEALLEKIGTPPRAKRSDVVSSCVSRLNLPEDFIQVSQEMKDIWEQDLEAVSALGLSTLPASGLCTPPAQHRSEPISPVDDWLQCSLCNAWHIVAEEVLNAFLEQRFLMCDDKETLPEAPVGFC